MKHSLKVMDHTGHTETVWDTNNQDEVSEAQKIFDRAKNNGMALVAMKHNKPVGGMNKFNPKVDIIATSAITAG